MYSAAIVLGLLAASVLSSPMPHGNHKHARQVVDVVDVVDVYTTVFINGPAPAEATPAPSPKAETPAPEEKVAEPVVHHQAAKISSAAPPPPPPASSAAPAPAASSASAPAPASAPSSGNTFLDLHNKYRALHGAQAMTWDSDLVNTASQQAQSCPGGDKQTGSNWYGVSDSEDDDSAATGAINAWYSEMDLYAQRSNNYASNPVSVPDNAPESGHFSQLIWNDSTKLGCAVNANCPTGGGAMKTQVTCLYSPIGNFEVIPNPSYVENVFPLGGKPS